MEIPENYVNVYTTPLQADQINRIILKYINPCAIITDATAGIGGNATYFCKKFKYVNLVENNYNVIELLKNNTSGYSNKVIYTCSYNTLKYILKQDVIFIDPPWGGTDYKNKKNINLFLDNENVLSVIENIYNYTQFVFLKVPNNFPQEIFSKFWNIRFHNVSKSKKNIYKIIVFYK